MRHVLAVASILGVSALAQQPNPLPGAKLGLDQIKEQFFRVSAGRRLKPKSWPGGARVAVNIAAEQLIAALPAPPWRLLRPAWPAAYPDEDRQYRRLFEQTQEVARFTATPEHPGPELRILRVK